MSAKRCKYCGISEFDAIGGLEEYHGAPICERCGNNVLLPVIYARNGDLFDALDHIGRQVGAVAADKGWREKERYVPEFIANIHAELSEAWEEYRGNYKPLGEIRHEEDGKPCGFVIEIADAIIRLLEMCDYCNLKIGHAVQLKNEYNKSRPYRHGGKRA